MMTADAVVRIASQALLLALLLSALPVLVAMVVGLVVSVLQAATQVQEQTLAIVPKIAAVFAVLIVGGGWMLRELARFAASVLSQI